ncbi:nickel-dependent lactate racemase [Anaeroselena agilis]|uniref:Nickel-dependent lactate racemase n=1 Tax=Anaeroselena agilis TaxID=3063788 RepID=A0ABU3NYX2_9FIRM|nr:nickel-dependent lactate racemase [Selenomonadales bacterium 4137-cl]
MAAISVKLPYGRETVAVSVPAANLLGVYSPKDVPPVADVQSEAARAVNAPIGTKPLRELAKGAKKVVIVADDNTRLTPTDKIIPVLLGELNAAGVADEQITVVIALGTHRFMTDEEILAKFGPEVVGRVRVVNHDYKNPAELVELGTTANGTFVAVNREAYEADFKLGVGSIVPHHIPGFAGGAKIVQPGISGERTTAETHLLSVRAPRSYLGVTDNPVRRELNEIARRIGLNTIFNTVLNRHGEVVGAFFGDVVEAFDAGVELSRAVYAVEVPEEADIVVSSSHPCDLEFWQAHKTLYPSDLAVKAGGIIILVTPCYEGVAVTHADMLDYTAKGSCDIRDMVACRQLGDEVAAALAIAWAQVKEREAVYIVSGGIAAAEAEKLGFTPFATVQEALDAALAAKGPGAKVTVLTHAPDMLPVIAGR